MLKINRFTYHQIINDYSLLLIAITLPLFAKINIVFISLYVINWLVEGKFSEKRDQLRFNKPGLVMIVFYFLYVISLFYSTNFPAGTSVLERKVSLLIFPIIMATQTIERKTVDRILFAFAASCFISVFASTIWVFYYSYQLAPSILPIGVAFFRENFAVLFDFHPTYYSLYIVFSMAIIIYLCKSNKKNCSWFWKSIAIIILLCFLCCLLFLSARTVIITGFFILLFSSSYYFLKRKNYWNFGIVILAISISSYLILQNPILNNRFRELIATSWNPPKGIYHNSTNMRVGITYCAIDGIRESWLTGLGCGAVQDYLNTCYKTNDYSNVLYKENYNSHNEYLDIWLSIGIPGLLIFLWIIYSCFRVALKNGDGIYLVFLILLSTSFLSECILDRQRGVVLFSFFNCLFAFHYFNKKQQTDSHKD